jgi:signal transduction histidine kinase
MPPSSQSSVLVISDDREFARDVAARWQTEKSCPEITIVTSDVWHAASGTSYELVVVGPVRDGLPASEIFLGLNSSPATATVCLTENEIDASRLRAEHPQVLVITRQDGWMATLILVSSEALRRTQAVSRAHRAERLAMECQSQAALGRYMLAMRPGINNALTSVLGNADLLMAETESIAKESRDQIRTMHSMTLRLNEIMQRFSSLASEMRMDDDESQAEIDVMSHRIAAH